MTFFISQAARTEETNMNSWTDIKMVNVRTWLPNVEDLFEVDQNSHKLYREAFGMYALRNYPEYKGVNGFARQKIYKNPNLSEKPYGEMVVRLGNNYKKFVKDGRMILSLTEIPDVGMNDGGSPPDSKMMSALFFTNSTLKGSFGNMVNYSADQLIWPIDKDLKDAIATEENSADASFLLLKDFIKKPEGTWLQLPNKVDDHYPWVLVKGFEEKSLEVKSVKGNYFWFSLGPEYVESEDGKTIYLMNHELKEKFKGRNVKLIDYERDPWGLYFGEKVENGYLYFKLPINFRNNTLLCLEILKKEPDKLYRISLKDLMLSNGNLRLEISNNLHGSPFRLLGPFSSETENGKGEFAPKNLSAKELILKILEQKKAKNKLTDYELNYKSKLLNENDVVW